MKNVVLKKKVNGYIIEIVIDENPCNPREDCNLGKMYCFHRKYNLGDKHTYNPMYYNGWGEFKQTLIKDEKVCVILPVYIYDHSGITINTTGFSCPWDSGQIGFIFATKEDVRKEYGVKRITKEIRKKVENILIGEVKTFDKYLNGESYGYIISKKNEDGTKEYIGSCFGYDDKEDCMREAELQIED